MKSAETKTKGYVVTIATGAYEDYGERHLVLPYPIAPEIIRQKVTEFQNVFEQETAMREAAGKEAGVGDFLDQTRFVAATQDREAWNQFTDWVRRNPPPIPALTRLVVWLKSEGATDFLSHILIRQDYSFDRIEVIGREGEEV